MYKGNTVGVVVPAYNEAGFVGDVIRTLPSFVDRVYAVDDCSTDGTWGEIQSAAESVNQEPVGVKVQADGGQVVQQRVVPIRHAENRGVGGAIKTGYKRALEDGIDVTAVVAGDGQMDPEILDDIVDPVAEGVADYAKGNRLAHSSYYESMSSWRLFGNTVLTILTKFVSGYWRMQDPQNGYTAISSHALERIDLDGLYDDYGFSNDLLVALNVQNVRIADVDMEAKYGEETSHIKYSRFVPKLSWLLANRALWRYKVKYLVTDFHPLVLLYVLGTLGVGASALFAGWVATTGGVGATQAVTQGLLTAIVLLLSGLCVTLAMIFDRADNRHLEQDGNGHLGGVDE